MTTNPARDRTSRSQYRWWRRRRKAPDGGRGTWTDAYPAAFTAASEARLVSFDRGFLIFPGIEFPHLHA